MYQFKSKETEDTFRRWVKNEALSHHPNDTELFYEFVLGSCLNEDRFSDVILHDLIEGQTNIWGHQFTKKDVPEFISKYEDLYNFYHFLKKKSDTSENAEKLKLEDFEKTDDVNQNSVVEFQKFSTDIQTILKNIENSIQDCTYKDKINKELHEELQNYKAGLREEIVKPILKSIIREYDRVIQQLHFYSQKAEIEPQSELFAKLLKEFNIISFGFLDILDDYNLVLFDAQEGDEFLPREHKILKVIKTNDISKDGKIAKCVKCGFRDIENERLLRQAEVNIYKISNNI